MDQAVTLAHRNNPDFLATRNNRRNASVELRSAYGALLPQLSASLSGQYQQGGQQFFNGVSLSSSSDVMQSQYQIGLNYRINAATFITPKVQRANSAAVNADIAGASVFATDYTGRGRLVVDRARGVAVGATFVGPEVAEMLHAATIAVVGEVPLDRLWHAVPAYPTVSEVWLRFLESAGL